MWWRKKKQEEDPFDPEYLAQYQARVDASEPFEMKIEDIFTITGRGTVVTGTISTGRIAAGDTVTVMRYGNPVLQTTVSGIEHFRRQTRAAEAGDQVGILVSVARDQLQSGDILTR